MTRVKILIEGYAKETESGWLASSTTTLIEDSAKKILVDPGINKELLLSKLEEEGLSPNNINIIFITHYHPDHVFLASIFEKAVVVDGDTVYEKDKETEYRDKLPGTSLKVIPTPGHAREHHVLLVETKKGKIVVAGDVFWWTTEEKQEVDDVNTLINKEDSFTEDLETLRESRKKVLEIADWIIPGHGKMFRNPQKQRISV